VFLRLLSYGCHTVSSVFPFCSTSDISSLARCSISHHFQTLHYDLSNSSREPSYLCSMLSLAPKPRELRSSDFHLLSVPRVKTHAGTRAFSVAVPTLWNSLSEHVMSSNNIVSFRYHLKTHLFQTRLSFLSFLSISSLLMNFASYPDYEFDQPLH